jgi:hypothetical protein
VNAHTHIECLDTSTWGRITTPLLNLIMIHDSNYLGDEFISFSQLRKSISFLFTLITILVIGNFNNGVVIRPIISFFQLLQLLSFGDIQKRNIFKGFIYFIIQYSIFYHIL